VGAAREVVQERVELGVFRLVVERPPSAEALIDEEAFARDEFLPYWAELWPSAVALARHVARLPLRGARVVELGCGLGLPSVAAALAGARVLATDWSEDALRFARRNAELNGAALTTRLVRWADPPPLPPARLVLAADVLYERRNADELARLLPRLVAPEGEALVADPGRTHARAFLEALDPTWEVVAVPAEELPRGAIHRLWRARRASDTIS
jgi:predicted nicotinamide N-methyase